MSLCRHHNARATCLTLLCIQSCCVSVLNVCHLPTVAQSCNVLTMMLCVSHGKTWPRSVTTAAGNSMAHCCDGDTEAHAEMLTSLLLRGFLGILTNRLACFLLRLPEVQD